MKKTLRNMLFGAVIVPVALAAGIGIGNIYDKVKNQKIPSQIEKASANREENQPSTEAYTLSNKEGSDERNLVLKTFKVKDIEDIGYFVNNVKIGADYPLLLKDDVLIEPMIDNVESLSPRQKEEYNKIIQDYAKRTGAEIILDREQAAEEISRVINPDKRAETSYVSNSNSSSENFSAGNTITIASEPAVAATSSGLENLFLKGREMNGMKYLSLEDEVRLLDISVEKMRKGKFIPAYQFNNHTIADGNPYVENSAGIEEISRKERQLRSLTGYGEAIYFIPSEKEEKQNTGNTSFIRFSVYLFDSLADRREAISSMRGYSQSIDNLVLIKGNYVITIDARRQINSPMQAKAYTKDVLDYIQRTSATISAENEQTQKYLEETLRKANEAIKNPSAYNFDSVDTVLESYFESTAESRRVNALQTEANKRYLEQIP